MGQPNKNPFNKIKCNTSNDTTVAQPGNGSIDIVNGANTLLKFPMFNFLPVNDYQYKEFTLAANTSPSTGLNTALLEACNTANVNGEDSAIIIAVDYPDYDVSNNLVATDDKFIKFTYGDQVMNIGKMMILTGTSTAGSGWDLMSSPGGMLLQNPHPYFAVRVRALIIA